MIKEGSAHNLLICDSIMHPDLHQLARGNSDPDVLQIIFAGGVGMIVILFTQYSVSMGIGLDLDETGAPALDALAVDLPFTCCLFHVILFPARSVACATECLAC